MSLKMSLGKIRSSWFSVGPVYSDQYPYKKVQYFGHLMLRANSLEETLMLGKIEGLKEEGAAEDEMVGWHHRLDGHEFEQTLGDTGGQRSLLCCNPWGRKGSDTS